MKLFRALTQNLRASWRSLIVSDLLFKAVALLLLTPLVSLLFRMFLALSGRSVLADADIARFLLHPLGWLAFTLVGGAIVCIFALELAVLMTICIGTAQQRPFRPGSVLMFVASRAAALLHLTSLIVARLGVAALPFVAACGGLFSLLLTEHDINYYLTHRPSEFWLAGSLISVLLLVMAGLLLQRLSGWIFATQLLLYEGLGPRTALQESQRRARGARMKIARAVATWAASNSLLACVTSFAVVAIGQLIVSAATGMLWTLVLSIGLLLMAMTITNLATSMLANASLASLLGLLYTRLATHAVVSLPDISERTRRLRLPELTLGRLLVVSVLVASSAALIGYAAIHGVDLEDRVQITAHRGGAGRAPENTLAAIRRAIEDGADWVEIDVQESEDGVVVVAHDSDLAKVAGNPVKIWETTADELRSIDIGSTFDPEFSGERVPTLEEVLQTCKGRVGVNIELKYYGRDQDLERRVIELVERFDMAAEIVVMSLEPKGLAKVKALRPEWTVGLLTAVAAGDLTRVSADFLAVKSRSPRSNSSAPRTHAARRSLPGRSTTNTRCRR